MRSISAFSSKENEEELLQDLSKQISAGGENPLLIIFFSENKIFSYLSKKLKELYPDATTIGSTSFINITNKGYGDKGASLLAVFSGIECVSGVLFDIDTHPLNYIQNIHNAMNELSTHDNTCCLEFTTAFSNGEELVLDTFEEAFEGTNITVIGGSSGCKHLVDDVTYVSLNGEVYTNTCAFCLIHNLEGRIYYYLENIYKPTEKVFITTDVDCETRTVYEFDNKPAADALAESLNVPLNKLTERLLNHPLGRIINKQTYITEIKDINPDGSISFFARIYNRSRVSILNVDDIDEVWKNTSASIKKDVQNSSFAFVVNCIGRSSYFMENKLFDKFLEFLKSNISVFAGVSGYGEQLQYTHLNESMVLAVFE